MGAAGKRGFFIAAWAILFLAAFPGSGACETKKIPVTVSVPPQAFFVEKIGGDRIALQTMIPRFSSPATYEPTPRQMIGLERSALYVKVGVPSFIFEKKYVDPILKRNRAIRVVSLSDGVSLLRGTSHRHEDGADGKGERGDSGDHGDGERDPHVWLSPAIVRTAAGRISEALSDIDPAGEGFYRANRDRFQAEIDSLDREIRDTLRGKEGLSFMVYHPAWGYFADAYGLEQIALEEGGKTPPISRIRAMIDLAREKDIPIIFVQKGFDTKSARLIAGETGGEVVEMDPLEKDWLENLKRFSEALKRTLR